MAGWIRWGEAIHITRDAYSSSAKEGSIMDPHFNEYLAAIAGMHDIYGDRPEEHPTDFHVCSASAGVEQAAVSVAAA
jgi:hypothetical protein